LNTGIFAEEIAAVYLPQRLADVLSRIRFNLSKASEGDKRVALNSAALKCAYCGKTGPCDEWIASHEQGEDNTPPDFCPSAKFMRSVEPPKE
jgi:hypothetical protein